jgi:hypothetical protein
MVQATIPYQRGAVFDPNDIKAMSTALDDVCDALRLDGNTKERELVAKRIIEHALHGERNPAQLRDSVLKEAQSGTNC